MSLHQLLARTCWHLVAHRSELAEDRDYLRLHWPLGDLVLFNDRGTVLAFDNLCPHRGARFFLDPAGNAPAVCAYHGWSYRGGQLRIPKPDSYRPCDLAKVRLREYLVAWCGDFLFAAADPDSSLNTQLDEAWPLIEGMASDIDRPHDLLTDVLQCPWQIAVENALEPDHVGMVHGATLGKLDLRDTQDTFFGQNSLISSAVGSVRHARALESMGRFFDLRHQHRGYRSLHVFPFAFVSSTFGYIYAHQTFMPARDGRSTYLRSRMFTARTIAPAAVTKQFFSSAAELNRQVFSEDHTICKRVDPDFPLDQDGILSDSEGKIRHLRSSLARYSPRLSP